MGRALARTSANVPHVFLTRWGKLDVSARPCAHLRSSHAPEPGSQSLSLWGDPHTAQGNTAWRWDACIAMRDLAQCTTWYPGTMGLRSSARGACARVRNETICPLASPHALAILHLRAITLAILTHPESQTPLTQSGMYRVKQGTRLVIRIRWRAPHNPSRAPHLWSWGLVSHLLW